MSPTPTTQQLNDQIITDLAGSLSQTIPLLPKAFCRVLARVLAAVVVLLFKYGGFIFLQLFVAHATYELTTILGKKIRPLEEWGILIGVGKKIAATPAELEVNLTWLADGELKGGTKLVRSETGVIYEVAFSKAITSTSFRATIRAVSDQQGGDGSGTIGNLVAGDTLSFANAPAFVGSVATVFSVLKTGVDAEAVEAYRQRIILRFQRKPQGGAYADYDQWGREAADIANIYPYTGEPGEVSIFVESATEVDGIPTGPQLDAVYQAITYDLADDTGLATRRPVNAALRIRPITRSAFDVNVIGLQPDTPETRTAIQLAVEEYFLSREPFIEGLSTLPRADRVTAAEAGGIITGVANSRGATVNGVTFTGPQAETLAQGEKAKLGSLNWV